MTGDPVRDFCKLAAGAGVLDWKMFWGILGKIRNRHRSRLCVMSRVANGMIRSPAFYLCSPSNQSDCFGLFVQMRTETPPGTIRE